MRGCAKFLNFLALIAWLGILIATVAFCAAAAVIFIKPELIPEDFAAILESIKVGGRPFTMEMFNGYRTSFIIIIGGLILILILTLVLIGRIRAALREIGLGDPFSIRCSSALSSASLLEVITGILGIALSCYISYIFGNLSADSGMVTNISVNLSFIPIAAFLKMLSGISEFGHR